jgi:hypothetical protein
MVVSRRVVDAKAAFASTSHFAILHHVLLWPYSALVYSTLLYSTLLYSRLAAAVVPPGLLKFELNFWPFTQFIELLAAGNCAYVRPPQSKMDSLHKDSSCQDFMLFRPLVTSITLS